MPSTMAYWGEDFCIIHGRDHMRSYMGNPIPFCEACEALGEQAKRAADKVIEDAKVDPDDLRKPMTI